MNLCGALLVAARGCAESVSDRKLGSANGNRMRWLPFHPVSARVSPFVFNATRRAYRISFHSVMVFCDIAVTSWGTVAALEECRFSF